MNWDKVIEQYRNGNEEVRKAIRVMHDEADLVKSLDAIDNEGIDGGQAAADALLKSVTFDKGAVDGLVAQINAGQVDGGQANAGNAELDRLLGELNKGIVDTGDGGDGDGGAGVFADAVPVLAGVVSALGEIEARQAGLEKAIGALGALNGRIATGLEALSRFTAGHVVRAGQLDAHIEAALAKSLDALRADMRVPRNPRGSEAPLGANITPAPEDRTPGAPLNSAPADAQQRLGLAKSIAFESGDRELAKVLNMGEQQAAYGHLDKSRFEALIQQANARLGRSF